jgi:polyvinyl alcohol dehydrogenase (cytochrome)
MTHSHYMYDCCMRFLAALFFLLGLSLARLRAADDLFALELYKKNCAQCHEQGGEARVPPRAALEKMSAAAVLRALESGAMREMGGKLTLGERLAVAGLLGRAPAAPVNQIANRCTASGPMSGPTWSSWGANLDNGRFQDAAQAKLNASDVPKLKLRWAFGVPEATSMRSQPAVYGGRVYLAGPDSVYSVDAATGCLHWAANAPAGIRSGLAIAATGARTLVVFGDVTGYVRALDAATGEPVWQYHADQHPAAVLTSTPAYYNGRLYFGVSSFEEVRAVTPGYVCCSFRGSIQALDAATGKLLWKTNTVAQAAAPGKNTKRGARTMGPSGAGVWTTPTLGPDRNEMFVTTGDNYSQPVTKTSDAVLAMAMDSGKILWSKQLTEGDAYNSTCPLADKANCPDADGPDFDFGSPAILVRMANRRVLVLSQKSGMVHGVDPDQRGKILWQARAGQGGTLGGIQWGAASDGKLVYAALSDIAWLSRTATGRKPDPARGGGMFAFRVDNGERMWMTAPPGCGDRSPCSPAQSAAVSAIAGAVFSGSVDGHIRAYSTADGKIIWDYDTVRDYQTVNGVPGKGGALDAGGPVIAGGILFVNSGYGQWSALPGNVLLAFSVDGK